MDFYIPNVLQHTNRTDPAFCIGYLDEYWECVLCDAKIANEIARNALPLAEQSAQSGKLGATMKGKALNVVGWHAMSRGDYSLAEKYFEECENLYDSNKSAWPIERANLYNRWAINKAYEGLIDAAQKLLALSQDLSHADEEATGRYFYFSGLVEVFAENYRFALERFADALEYLRAPTRFREFARVNLVSAAGFLSDAPRESLEALLRKVQDLRLSPDHARRPDRDPESHGRQLLKAPKQDVFDAAYRWTLGILVGRLINPDDAVLAAEERSRAKELLLSASETFLRLEDEAHAALVMLDLADLLVMTTRRTRWGDVQSILEESLKLVSDNATRRATLERLLMTAAVRDRKRFHEEYLGSRKSLL